VPAQSPALVDSFPYSPALEEQFDLAMERHIPLRRTADPFDLHTYRFPGGTSAWTVRLQGEEQNTPDAMALLQAAAIDLLSQGVVEEAVLPASGTER
jgi:hypothetical protein